MCVSFLGTDSLLCGSGTFFPPKMKCISVFRAGPLNSGIRYAAAASRSAEAERQTKYRRNLLITQILTTKLKTS